MNTETFDTFSEPFDTFELHRTEDITALRSHLKVKHLHLLSTDGYSNHIRETLEHMDKETYNLFIKYHLATCERQDMPGYSNHTLDIFRKEE